LGQNIPLYEVQNTTIEFYMASAPSTRDWDKATVLSLVAWAGCKQYCLSNPPADGDDEL